LLDESGENKRGIALYIRNELKEEELTIEGNVKESIWIKIKLNGKDRMLIGCMYKSPS
jgi:hypothetical protein